MSESKKRKQAANGNPEPSAAPAESARGRINIRQTTRLITTLAILSALLAVLSVYCTIHTDTLKITLTFIPVVVAARLYGAWGAGVVAGMGDVICWFFNSQTGMLFPPITLTAVVTGVFFGLLLKNNRLRSKSDMITMLLSVVISQLISLFVTPIWLNMLYGTSYEVLLMSRLIQIAVMTVIHLIMVPVMLKSINAVEKQLRFV